MDLNIEAYANYLTEHGSPTVIESMAYFGSSGSHTTTVEPEPALEAWDGIQSND